jgi:hypothetical protein
MSNMKNIAALGLLGVLMTPSAHALIAVDNTANGLAFFAPIAFNLRAQSFTTSSTGGDYLLTDIQAYLTNALPSSNYRAELWSDVGGIQPGALLQTLTAGTSTGFGLGVLQTLTPTSSFALQANATYWLVLGQQTNSPNTFFIGTNNFSESGLSGWSIGNLFDRSFNNGATWATSSFAAQMIVDVDLAPTVPEPASLSLFAIGALGAASAKRKRK